MNITRFNFNYKVPLSKQQQQMQQTNVIIKSERNTSNNDQKAGGMKYIVKRIFPARNCFHLQKVRRSSKKNTNMFWFSLIISNLSLLKISISSYMHKYQYTQ